MGYLDNSGLYVKIGPETAISSTGGEYRTPAELREIELTISPTAALYPFGASFYIVNDNIFFPKSVRIQEVETYVDTAVVGAGTIDLGLIQTDRVTVTSATAFLTAYTPGAAGTKTVVTTGGLVGTTTTNVNHISLRMNTANITAGILKIRIRYYRT